MKFTNLAQLRDLMVKSIQKTNPNPTKQQIRKIPRVTTPRDILDMIETAEKGSKKKSKPVSFKWEKYLNRQEYKFKASNQIIPSSESLGSLLLAKKLGL